MNRHRQSIEGPVSHCLIDELRRDSVVLDIHDSITTRLRVSSDLVPCLLSALSLLRASSCESRPVLSVKSLYCRPAAFQASSPAIRPHCHPRASLVPSISAVPCEDISPASVPDIDNSKQPIDHSTHSSVQNVACLLVCLIVPRRGRGLSTATPT